MNRRVDLLKASKLLALIIVLFICFTGVISWKLENKAEGSTLSNLVKRVEDTSVLTSASKAKGNDLILVNKQNFLENDYLSGLIRFVDAFLTAGCIAIGVGVALRFWMFAMGGML